MTSGRAMAQASHASNAFIKRFGKDKCVQKWQRETTQGFGTAIVLAANMYQIRKIMITLTNHKIKEEVIDPDYVISVSSEIFPYIASDKMSMFESVEGGKRYLFHREEVTCAYVFGTKEELDPILGHLNLHP
jgi:hypothetical protein